MLVLDEMFIFKLKKACESHQTLKTFSPHNTLRIYHFSDKKSMTLIRICKTVQRRVGWNLLYSLESKYLYRHANVIISWSKSPSRQKKKSCLTTFLGSKKLEPKLNPLIYMLGKSCLNVVIIHRRGTHDAFYPNQPTDGVINALFWIGSHS